MLFPLNNNNTYLALGFQGNYTFSKIAYSGSFPGSFDQYGALGAALSSDPVQSGYQYNYFTAGVGLVLFHSGLQKTMVYRRITSSFQPALYRLDIYCPATYECGDTGRLCKSPLQMWMRSAVSAFLPGRVVFVNNLSERSIPGILDDSSQYALSVGISYRAGDALIPNLALKFGDNQIAFYYEFNIIGSAYSASYNRTIL